MVELELREKTISASRKALVMGILNATPDSFYAGSRGGVEKALAII